MDHLHRAAIKLNKALHLTGAGDPIGDLRGFIQAFWTVFPVLFIKDLIPF